MSEEKNTTELNPVQEKTKMKEWIGNIDGCTEVARKAMGLIKAYDINLPMNILSIVYTLYLPYILIIAAVKKEDRWLWIIVPGVIMIVASVLVAKKLSSNLFGFFTVLGAAYVLVSIAFGGTTRNPIVQLAVLLIVWLVTVISNLVEKKRVEKLILSIPK